MFGHIGYFYQYNRYLPNILIKSLNVILKDRMGLKQFKLWFPSLIP